MQTQLSVNQALQQRAKICAETYVGNLKHCAECLGSAFNALNKYEDEELCDMLRNKAEGLAGLEVSALALGQALSQVGTSYNASDTEHREKMQFKDAVEAEVKKANDAHPMAGHPKRTSTWAKWCDETGDEAEATGMDDDGIEGVVGGDFKNIKCTLTQKSIFDLNEPVQDSHDWIWEKSAIVEYIRRKGGRPANPAQLHVVITVAELKDCSKKLKRVAEKQRRQQLTQTQKVAEEIL